MNSSTPDSAVAIGACTDSMPPNESRARTGEILAGRYQLLEKIGEGGMGEVYVARHLVLGRRFAVKLLHPELVRSARLLRRFSREALAASCLDSDHVVAVTDCGHTSDGTPFYVMELLKGSDLRQLLHRAGPLPLQRVLSIVLDVCRGLSAAHANGLVHRDLKPENIFLVTRDDGSQSAKILDFGVVQLRDENSNSRPGSLIGTVKYMSPEQVLAEGGVDVRADIYALGVIVYECLTGYVPFAGGSTEEVLFRILNATIRPLRETTTELPDGFEEIVMRALARSPDDRYSTIADFAQSLLHFRGENCTQVANTSPLIFADSRSKENGDSDRTMTKNEGSLSALVRLHGAAAKAGSVARRIAFAAAASIAAWLVIWQVQAKWPAARSNAPRAGAVSVIHRIKSTTMLSGSGYKPSAKASASGAAVAAPSGAQSIGFAAQGRPTRQGPHSEARARQGTGNSSANKPNTLNAETAPAVSPYPAIVFDKNNPYESPPP